MDARNESGHDGGRGADVPGFRPSTAAVIAGRGGRSPSPGPLPGGERESFGVYPPYLLPSRLREGLGEGGRAGSGFARARAMSPGFPS